MVTTPQFLDEATIDAGERFEAYESPSLDLEAPELVRAIAVELEGGWYYFLDETGDISRRPLARRRGQRPEKVVALGIERAAAFGYWLEEVDGRLGIYRAPVVDEAGDLEARVVTPRASRSQSHAGRVSSKASAPDSKLTLFSWGYEGWGSSLPQLMALTEAAERSRGFEPPVFVDARFSRSVRAAGFRDRVFEQALPPGRYHWMKGLGNQAIGEGGAMRLHRPGDVAELLRLAADQKSQGRRVIFFCSCGPLHGCHRNLVRDEVIAEARRQKVALEVAEWPGGEPRSESLCTLTLTPKELSRVFNGGPRIAITEEVALGALAALPWGGYVEVTDGERRATICASPVRYSAGNWFFEPFVHPVEEGDTAEEHLSATMVRLREEGGYKAFRSQGK